MFFTKYYRYRKHLRNCDISGYREILNVFPLRYNFRQISIRRTQLYIENKWNPLLQQNSTIYPERLKLNCSDERFCKISTKYIGLKHDCKLFSCWVPTLGIVSIPEVCNKKSYINTCSEFLNKRHYGTTASNQPLSKNSDLLKEHIQDVQSTDDNLISCHKLSKKQLGKIKALTETRLKQTKASKQACLKEAEKDFEIINKKHVETRNNFLLFFPLPKSNLSNLYQSISSHLNKAISVKTEYERPEQPRIWKCKVTVPWPELKSFEGSAKSKQEAANRAALGALIWLQEKNVLNAKGQLALLTTTTVQEVKNKPVADVTLSNEAVTEISDLLDRYSKEVLENMKNFQDYKSAEDSECVDNYISEENILMPQNMRPKSEEWILQRNEVLFNRYNNRKQLEAHTLPISSYRENFLHLLTNNRVVVVKGEPGCGKSTQVPQYIFDNYASKIQGTNCKIVVTQPRRISAISLAEYIAYERNESVGDVTGYQVRLKSVLPHPQGGSIIFCSTGILLRKIINDPGLSDISHVIIDEAHERDVNTDFLLALVKRGLQINPKLKVVIMSATINAELFQNYFSNAPALHVPGFTYPVKQQFLDEHLANIIGIKNVNEFCQSPQPKVDCKAVANMVFWINSNRPEGAVLVFLPGWSEIQQTMKYLQEQNRSNGQLFVVPVHSKLSYRQQKQIFDKPPKETRKIILATNIAETSITIDDVVYVIDTGAHKEQRLDMKTGIACLDNHWVSAANVKQRQGRAGRVQPGESFHLYTKDKYYGFDTFPTPEIFRVPLEKSVLDCKMYSATDEKIEDFFSQLPEPPDPKAIRKAVTILKSLDALDSEEDLTPLGRRIYLFTTHPYLSKALVHAAIFKCINPVLTIATLMSSDYQVFYNIMENKEFIKSVKQAFSPCSDHMALAWLYHQWEQYKHQGKERLETYCKEKGIYGESMALTEKLRILLGDYLYKSQLIDSSVKYTDFSEECNNFARNDEFVKAVLLSGLGKLLLARNFKLMKGRMKHCNDIITQTGQSAKVGSDSVNSGRKIYPSPFLTYFRAISSLERPVLKIWDSSIVSPIAVLLFFPGIISMKNMKDLDSSKTVLSIKGYTPINITCDNEQAKLILDLRQVLWTVVEYLVEHQGHPADEQQFEVVSKFRDNMLQVLSKLLLEQGENIDYNEKGELCIS